MPAVVAAHPADFRLEWLPPDAPERNPEAVGNGAVKRELLTALPDSVADLHRRARRAFIRLGHHPSHLRGFFNHAGLSLT